jgi:glutaconate CoA-transferase subunit B
MVLVYESGAIGAKPTVAPLSIADSELAETADFLVSVPEIFSYWLRGGRIKMAVLGTAQIDRFGNLNTTVVGDYKRPKVRLPGAGGAPEIASSAGEIVVIVRHTPKAFVSKIDFATTVARRMNLRAVITDLGVLKPDSSSGELVLVSQHPNNSIEQIQAATGWPLQVATSVETTFAPTDAELATLREIEERTRLAHAA